MNYFKIQKDEWDKTLRELTGSHTVFASVINDYGQDYEVITEKNIGDIIYNTPKPATSLKTFFIPVRENVTADGTSEKPLIIIGIPNCDAEALRLLDEIYLDPDFTDKFYKNRRDRTLLITTDCLSVQEHCHCTSYDISPFSTHAADLSVISLNGSIIIRTISTRGNEFVSMLPDCVQMDDSTVIDQIDGLHAETENLLRENNKKLPGYKATGRLIEASGSKIWEKYSSTCVSCGACTVICPTCTCFLLIDKPGFEKIRQTDACQYPGFERVAGGEDPLHEIADRFRNRYMCKYFWKPRKFHSQACTGCGRCIEACIGKINKNELFRELAG